MNPDGSSNTNPLQTYTVIPGDNLYDIARSKGITLQEIEAANPQIANFDIIHPGDIVNIPTAGAVDTSTGASGAGATGSYTVAAGDNLSEIAQAHGMSLQEIESSNPQIQNFDLIHPGEVINLPGSSASPAPTTDTSGVNGGTSSTDSSTTSPITSTPSTDPNQQTDPTTNGSTDTTTTPDPTQTTTPPVSGSTDPGSSGTDTTSPSPSDSTTPTTTTNPGDQGSVGSPGVGVEGANDLDVQRIGQQSVGQVEQGADGAGAGARLFAA